LEKTKQNVVVRSGAEVKYQAMVVAIVKS